MVEAYPDSSEPDSGSGADEDWSRSSAVLVSLSSVEIYCSPTCIGSDILPSAQHQQSSNEVTEATVLLKGSVHVINKCKGQKDHLGPFSAKSNAVLRHLYRHTP